MKINVGVFWLCNFDIIYDVEEIEIDENQKELFVFSKQHKDVWKELSLKQFGGKYSKYSYDFFQRGRVYYNSATKQHFIVMNDLRKELPKFVLEFIDNKFEINKWNVFLERLVYGL